MPVKNIFFLVLFMTGFIPVISSADDLKYESILQQAEQAQLDGPRAVKPLLQLLEDIHTQASENQQRRLSLIVAQTKIVEGDNHNAYLIIEKILEDSASPPALRVKARALMTQGLILESDYEKAFRQLYETLEELKTINDQKINFIVFNLAARVFSEAGDTALSDKYARETQALAERLGDPKTICIANTSYLSVLNTSQKFDDIVEYSQKTAKSCDSQSELLKISALSQEASALMNLGQYVTAEALITECISMFSKIGYEYGTINSGLILGSIQWHQGKIKKAKKRSRLIFARPKKLACSRNWQGHMGFYPKYIIRKESQN